MRASKARAEEKGISHSPEGGDGVQQGEVAHFSGEEGRSAVNTDEYLSEADESCIIIIYKRFFGDRDGYQ